MVNVSAECRALYRPRYRPTVGRYIDRHSADMSVNISTDTSTDISRSIYRPCVDRYIDRHIGRVSVDMSTDVSVECRSIYRPIHRSRGAQNTHDPRNLAFLSITILEKNNHNGSFLSSGRVMIDFIAISGLILRLAC